MRYYRTRCDIFHRSEFTVRSMLLQLNRLIFRWILFTVTGINNVAQQQDGITTLRESSTTRIRTAFDPYEFHRPTGT